MGKEEKLRVLLYGYYVGGYGEGGKGRKDRLEIDEAGH